VAIGQLNAGKASLEDVFLRLTSEPSAPPWTVDDRPRRRRPEPGMSVTTTTRPAPRPRRPRPVHQQVRAQAGLELRLLLRNGESLLVSFGIPLGVLVFASVVVPVSLGDGEPLDALVPAILALSVMSTAFTAQAIQTGFQRKYAVLKRLGATPLSRSAFLASKALAVSAWWRCRPCWCWPSGSLLGWRVAGWTPACPAGRSGCCSGTATFTALGLLLAGALKAELTLALANAIYLVLAAVGGLALRSDGEGTSDRMIAAATPCRSTGAAVHARRCRYPATTS
jgi:ABC-2 type transport system permease protein